MTSGPLNSGTAGAHTYDARNRLTAVAASGAAPALSYIYDSEGNRTAITQAGQTTTFAINSAAALSQVLVRTKQDGSKTYYVHGTGLLYEVNEAGSTLTYHYDYRGSTVALTDGTGNVQERLEYNAYGRTTWRSGTTDTPFLYNGRYGVMTDANGLLNMRARYYNPFLRRFLNADPAAMTGGMNWYAYADGNPVSYLDPFGLGSDSESQAVSWLKYNAGWAYDQAYGTLAMASALGYELLGTGADLLSIPFGMPAAGNRLHELSRYHYSQTSPAAEAGWYNPGDPGVRTANVVLFGLSLKPGPGMFRRAAQTTTPKLLGPGTQFGEKIIGDMRLRGWTKDLVQSAIDKPTRTVPWRDTRRLPTGGRMSDPATVYYSQRGGYVVRNDRTGDIVQVSNRTRSGWKAPWD